jgi:hypothetical protein
VQTVVHLSKHFGSLREENKKGQLPTRWQQK